MFAIHTTNTCTHILQTSTKQAKKYTDQLLVCVVVRHVRVREKETLELLKRQGKAQRMMMIVGNSLDSFTRFLSK